MELIGTFKDSIVIQFTGEPVERLKFILIWVVLGMAIALASGGLLAPILVIPIVALLWMIVRYNPLVMLLMGDYSIRGGSS